jgi:arylsulfatase A-like enzyme
MRITNTFLCLLLLMNVSMRTVAQTADNAKQPRAKPNVLFILVDDLGWTDLGVYGSTFYETPNIDALAKGGIKFNNAYAASPVCSPTRASIMTGKYPTRIKTTDWFGAPQPEAAKNSSTWKTKKLLPAAYTEYLPLEETTMAEAFKAHGYATFMAGKWHLGEDEKYWPENQGFDINKGGFSMGHPKSYFSPYKNPRLEDGPTGEYLAERLTNETIAFIEQNKSKPFFAYFPLYEVHGPFQAKESVIKKYEEKKARLNLEDKYEVVGGVRTRANQSFAVYAAMVEAMDNAVGAVMNKLKELGLEENTIVVFFSDNGGLATSEGLPTSNAPLRAGKGWVYEGGIREPLIIKYPAAIEKGSENNTPVISTDFFPTLLQLSGLPLLTKQHVDGVSLVPLFKNKKIKRDALYWHYPHYGNQGGAPASAIRYRKWKLIEQFESNTFELYDLAKDPGERNNLIDREPSIAKKLKTLLMDWRTNQQAILPQKNELYNK